MTTTHRQQLMLARPEATDYAASLLQVPHIGGLHGAISSFHLYPIKALGPLTPESVRIGHKGLESRDGALRDRSAMLAVPSGNNDGTYVRLSLRDEPALARIGAYLTKRGLEYRTPGMKPLVIRPFELLAGPKADVTVDCAGDRMEAAHERGQITEWIRSFLAAKATNRRVVPEKVSVLLETAESARFVAPAILGSDAPAETAFSDGGQLLVTSEATLQWMNDRIGGSGVAMGAFRPNIVLRNLPPNLEDIVGSLVLDSGEVLTFGGLCVRCTVTTLDPLSGERRKDGQPLKLLSSARPPRADKPSSTTFGVNAHFDRSYAGRVLERGISFTVAGEKP